MGDVMEGRLMGNCRGGQWLMTKSASPEQAHATFHAMRFAPSYFFGYFWFSHRPAVGEASAQAQK
jgi:hypothetical protein